MKSRGRSGARDGPSSSQVCFKCGSNDHWARECPKMDYGPSNPKKRNLGAYAYGAWTCNDPGSYRDEECSPDTCQVDLLRVAAVSPVQDDDECEAHAALLVHLKVSVFWTVVQPLPLVALIVQRPCSPRVTNMILEFERLIRLVVAHPTLEMVLHQRLLPCPDSLSEMVLLVTSGSLCICSWISRNRLR